MVCKDTMGLITRYLWLGVPPGSFVTALLVDDTQAAYRSRPDVNDDIVVGMMAFIDRDVPTCCRGDIDRINQWIAHDGWAGAGDAARVAFRLGVRPQFFRLLGAVYGPFNSRRRKNHFNTYIHHLIKGKI